ncbi:DUF2252 domain-containing protein [Microbacterium sp.]|uniref:DUF2252 domain-containing protein n=1 Tax=Microbacterium sp. TaxID=51671 RepID=UPI003C7513D8
MSLGPPLSRAEQTAAGRDRRHAVPRRNLSQLTTTGRDPLGILEEQNQTRVAELVPLRTERMSASPFTFYRGTAALMAADLARDESSGIAVASCGDVHVANFGLYASPQRDLVFDLNDFDESAWAPWEWDLKRLVTSVVVAGRATGRDDDVVGEACLATVRTYARLMTVFVERSPLARYYEHFDAEGGLGVHDKAGRHVVRDAIRQARKRTGEQAARKLTQVDADGRRWFVEAPPAMTHTDAEIKRRAERDVLEYARTASVDIQLLLQHYSMSDTVRRAVGVGSVGTRCFVTVFQDGDENVLLLQTKQAGQSVLAQYGEHRQPQHLNDLIDSSGEGARVVALQRILQGVSDPFLGHFRNESGDYYVRQFRDMKGGIDIETLDDGPFSLYAQACAATLARAHSQSPNAAAVAGYVGRGEAVADALLEWSYAYADVSKADYEAFLAASA